MRRFSVFLWVLLLLSVFLVSNASAYEYGVEQFDTITLLNHGNGLNGGGEFNWQAQDDGYTFASFCLERNEYISPGGSYNIDSITSGAMNGGVGGPNPDPISDQTAWLFWNFSRGTLDGYDGTSIVQAALQNLIWFFEEEITMFSGIGIEGDWWASADAAIADGWNNLDGKVAVLNLSRNGNPAQDQLVAAAPVPEPETMVLLGIGLLFIAGIVRKKQKP